MAKHTRHASDLVKTRKRVKKLRRQAENRIRKARKQAIKSNDSVALEKLKKIERDYKRPLTPIGKEQHLSRKMRSNVNREIGKELKLERLIKNEALNFKKQKRVTSKTYERIYGSAAKNEVRKIGIREAKRRSNQFWEQVYKAQDMLVASGFVPIEEVYGRGGSAGSDLVAVASSIVRNSMRTHYSKRRGNWVTKGKHGKETSISEAIFNHYKKKYGM